VLRKASRRIWREGAAFCVTCNVFSHVPNSKIAEVARMRKALHALEDRKAADGKVQEVVARLRAMKLTNAAELVEQKALERLRHAPGRCIPGRDIGTDA
jgi:hypothetical protein